MKYKLKIRYKLSPFHPEQTIDEIFISNETKKTFKQIKWQTKRLGKIAYEMIPMLKGKELIPIKGMQPCFVLKSEIEEYKESKFIKEKK